MSYGSILRFLIPFLGTAPGAARVSFLKKSLSERRAALG